MHDISSDTDTHIRFNQTRCWTFLSTWRSVSGFLFLLLTAGALLFFGGAAGMPAHANAGKTILALLAALCAWGSILIGLSLVSRRPYLQFDFKGISGKALRKKTIAWNEVANISLVNKRLRFDLTPQSSGKPALFGGKTKQRLVPLAGVPAAEQPAILRAAHEAFRIYSPNVAVQAVATHRAETEALAAFEVRLRNMTPRVWAMPAMVAICVLVWIANVANGMDAFQPDSVALYRWGANATSAVQAEEWWRLVTAMFLHGGIAHLAFNMFALWESGILVSRLFGNRGFLLIYFGSGIAGGALSLHFSAQTHISVGASGAIFGVTGALLAAVIQHRGHFPVARSRQLLTGLGIFIVYSLMNGFAKQGIDNAAHIGGLIAGILIGGMLVEKLDNHASQIKRLSHFAAAALVCAIGCIGLTLAAPPAQRDLNRYFADLRTWQSLQPEIQHFQTMFRQDVAKVQSGQATEIMLLQQVQTTYLPMVHGFVGTLSALRFPVNDMPDRYIRAQRQWLVAMEAFMQAQVEHLRFPSVDHAQAVARLADELKKARADLDKANAELAKDKSA